MTCVDLRERFGRRYRVRREADRVTWFETPEAERVWLLEIPCRYGVAYPRGGDLLAAVVTGRYARQQVAALPCIRSRRGDAELVVTFHVDDAEPVLTILRPWLRRQVSAAERERLAALSRSHGAAGLARAHQRRREGRIALSKSGRRAVESTQAAEL